MEILTSTSIILLDNKRWCHPIKSIQNAAISIRKLRSSSLITSKSNYSIKAARAQTKWVAKLLNHRILVKVQPSRFQTRCRVQTWRGITHLRMMWCSSLLQPDRHSRMLKQVKARTELDLVSIRICVIRRNAIRIPLRKTVS